MPANYIEIKLNPRFKDTDALGHINNAAITTWFEEGRQPIFKYFVPDLDPKKWNLIIARIEVDYLAQASYQGEVLIKTSVSKVGNSSFQLNQEAFQNSVLISRAKSFLVHFDYKTQSSVRIPEDIREKLNQHFFANPTD